jgi:hypothetical protein
MTTILRHAVQGYMVVALELESVEFVPSVKRRAREGNHHFLQIKLTDWLGNALRSVRT